MRLNLHLAMCLYESRALWSLVLKGSWGLLAQICLSFIGGSRCMGTDELLQILFMPKILPDL